MITFIRSVCFFLIFLSILLTPAIPGVIHVGPDREIKLPSQAAQVASNGDTILIDAGEYVGDVTAWEQNDIVIRGVGGRAHMRANGEDARGKGTWVVTGDNITVENIEFSEAAVEDENGAGIRAEGLSLIIRNCYFHDNENGILGPDDGEILIEYSEFANNGYGDGRTHNMYILEIDKFTLRYSYSHNAIIGHNVKSRAKENYIEYNRIMDESDGLSSYAIDIPNGGETYIIGNLIQQGPGTDNSTIVSYGAEGLKNPNKELYFINNSVVNDRGAGTFLYVESGATALIQNNIFAKSGTVLNGPGNMVTNFITSSPGFVNINTFDYRLSSNSDAINAGSEPVGSGYNLEPQFEYVHPLQKVQRTKSGIIDIGAYEYDGTTALYENSDQPGVFQLDQNYPNPFNPKTTISFTIPKSGHVVIEIYDVNGQFLKTLTDGIYTAGLNKIDFDGVLYGSGVYYYRIKAGNFTEARKMLLLK